MKKCSLLIALILATVATGCSSIKPLTSQPGIQTLVLQQPYVAKGGLQTLTMPAGEYHASMEDEPGYFYPAPAKLIGHDVLGNYLLDGGIYRWKDPAKGYAVYHISPRLGTPDKWKLPREFEPMTK